MNAYTQADSATLNLLLHELKSKFDQKLIEGETFEEAKKVYMQIKQIESQLDFINWHNTDGKH